MIHVRAQGGRVVLASHLGRPKGEARPELSLAAVAGALGIPLASDCIGPDVTAHVSAEPTSATPRRFSSSGAWRRTSASKT